LAQKPEMEKTKTPEKELAQKPEMEKTKKPEKEDVPVSETKQPEEEKEIVSEDKPEKEEETDGHEPETDAKRVKVKVTNYSPAKIAGLQVIISSTIGSLK
jgi:hypothetical protein